MCLDALHDRGFTRINIGIARYAFKAHGVSFRWSAVLPVASGLLKQDAQLSQRDRAAGCVIVFAK